MFLPFRLLRWLIADDCPPTRWISYIHRESVYILADYLFSMYICSNIKRIIYHLSINRSTDF